MQFVVSFFFIVSYFKTANTSYLFPGFLFLMVGFLLVWCYRLWAVRIPFARVMLKTVTEVTKRYPAMIGVAVAGLISQSLFAILWITSMVGYVQYSIAEEISENITYLVFVYSLFVFYWTSEVIKNTVHITVAGVFTALMIGFCHVLFLWSC